MSAQDRPLWVRALLWVLAVVLMLSAAVYQRRTGPTYPLGGRFEVAGESYSYKLVRSEYSSTDARVVIPDPGAGTTGRLHFKRYKTQDELTSVPMQVAEAEMFAMLPAQPAAGKLEYYVTLETPGGELRFPEAPAENVIIRFKDEVPVAVLLAHILLMFFSMLVGMRCGLAAIFAPRGMRVLAWISLIGISIGGMILGPIVQKYTFGEFWTGFPRGYDLTDNKALIMWLAWVIACAVIGLKPKKNEVIGRLVVVAATVVMTTVYLIPHSLRGSELDYSQVDAGVPASEAVTTGD
ncbi:MAG: hypothetical protein GY856_55040 [bacterium]|nr:hypothetical protein [bacterium]